MKHSLAALFLLAHPAGGTPSVPWPPAGQLSVIIYPLGSRKWEVAPAPSVKTDYHYDFSKTNGPLLRVTTINRDASFTLLEQALVRLAKP